VEGVLCHPSHKQAFAHIVGGQLRFQALNAEKKDVDVKETDEAKVRRIGSLGLMSHTKHPCQEAKCVELFYEALRAQQADNHALAESLFVKVLDFPLKKVGLVGSV
jgi:hypothetical protein